jgi:sortase A
MISRLLLLLSTTTATLLVAGLWIPFKAVLAQELLELAWAESRARQTEVKPWPWADTWPVARLSFPGESGSVIVLQGAHGESLAFGPGWLAGSGSVSEPVVIAGHRDTHFARLAELESGTLLQVEHRSGESVRYRVRRSRVVDSRREMIDLSRLPPGTLMLVTCYPFDAVDAGGPLRYVIEAEAELTAAESVASR